MDNYGSQCAIFQIRGKGTKKFAHTQTYSRIFSGECIFSENGCTIPFFCVPLQTKQSGSVYCSNKIYPPYSTNLIACGKTPHINRMSKEKDLDLGPEFDDQECIDFILNLIPAEDRGNMTEDDIQYVLDVIFEYYDQAGLIDEDDTASEGVIDENEEFEFVKKAVKKDGIQLTDQQIQLILDGEFEYGLEKGIYEEDED